MAFLSRAGHLKGMFSMSHNETATASADTLNALIKSGELLPVEEASKLVKYTTMGIRKIAERGKIQDIRIGHAHFVLRSELVAYVNTKKGRRQT